MGCVSSLPDHDISSVSSSLRRSLKGKHRNSSHTAMSSHCQTSPTKSTTSSAHTCSTATTASSPPTTSDGSPSPPPSPPTNPTSSSINPTTEMVPPTPRLDENNTNANTNANASGVRVDDQPMSSTVRARVAEFDMLDAASHIDSPLRPKLSSNESLPDKDDGPRKHDNNADVAQSPPIALASSLYDRVQSFELNPNTQKVLTPDSTFSL